VEKRFVQQPVLFLRFFVLGLLAMKYLKEGLKRTPVPAVSFQAGLKNEDNWIWSLGMGFRFRNFIVDLAVVPHPYLNNQLQGSLAVSW